ncbi:hypothetical protein GHT06_014816 [Daphnia sinensis]|uniref:Peptidase C1A papain C-terminal domain-containing protein n=1 Tax=Daphnia sinensis TaxID=1820382 RepID=A0AAD5LHZ7_9CRUS|nr:hypothetical protein GHT06_014816 [Daphnia sinensis]
MKFLVVMVVFAMAVSVIDGQSDDEAWAEYKKEHGKNYWTYLDGGLRDRMRKRIFLYQNAEIKKHNSGKLSTYTQTQNFFTDMRPSEWKRYLGANPSAIPSNIFEEESNNIDPQRRQSIPAKLSYKDDPCMPDVKNQGSCGSCWAFAAINPLEFAQCKKGDVPIVLSEKQLVDCDRSNGGCQGGWYTDAWDYIKRVRGSAKTSLYGRYNARRGICRFRQRMIGAKVLSYKYVKPNDVVAMQDAMLKYGPLAVALTVANTLVSYGSGIYDDPACDNREVNHAVVLVGWDTVDGVDYWIARNSWGDKWGEKGYFRIKRGVNKCKIENYAAYVEAV